MKTEDWFSQFTSYYKRRHRNHGSELWFSDPSDEDQSGWSAVMGVFLSRLARRFELKQDWEWSPKRFDFAWVKGPSGLPRTLIEHESWYNTKKSRAMARKIRNLMSERLDGDPHRIFITYTDRRAAPREDFVARVSSVVRPYRSSRGEFLLVIGTQRMRGASPWRGYHWSNRENKLLLISE